MARNRRRRLEWSGGRILRVCLCVFGALIVTAAVLRTGMLATLLDRESPAAAILGPNDASAIFQAAEAEFRDNGGRVSEATALRVRAVASQAPLAGEPFLYAGARLQAAGDLGAAIRFLEEARRRDPRMRPARLLLFELYIRAGRTRDAVGELAVLGRLMDGELGDLLAEELTLLAMDPGARPDLSRALGHDPLMDQILTRLVARGASTDIILSLARPRLASYSLSSPPAWQHQLVESRIAAGDFENAQTLWRMFNRLSLAPDQIYNPPFGPHGPTPPFGWDLKADDSGVAEATADGALDVVYFGRGDAELARRIVLLRPGTYRLQLIASSNDQAGGSHLAWRVACAASGTALADLSLDRLASGPARLAAAFNVPNGCGALWLRLVGEAGDFPTRRELRISNFTVTRGTTG